MRKLLSIIAVCSALMLASCNGNYIYNDCEEINENGWKIDVPAVFAPQIDDTIGHYNVLLTIRHTAEYEYQNFWAFVTVTSPEGLTASDTIECFLADNQGHFLGSGISIYEMPVLISQNLVFDSKGDYVFEVTHGMRDENLKGIRNICLSIERKK